MKTTRIILIIFIIVGFVLTVTQHSWLPKLLNTTPASESTLATGVGNIATSSASSSADVTCHELPAYLVVERSHADSVGSDIIVKYKTNANPHPSCDETIASDDFALPPLDATYFLIGTDEYLVLDQGTAPEPRGLIVYDVHSRKQVFTAQYARPIGVDGETLTYWGISDTKATTENCTGLNEYTKEGLGAVIEEKVTLDLPTLIITKSGEKRCLPTQ